MQTQTSRRRPGRCGRTLAVAIAFACASGAFAPAHGQLEEIVVTAQKRAQGANDLGITMNAFTGETVKDLGIFSAEEIALYTPGLSVNAAAATGVPVYTIRGVGFQDLTTSSSSTVGLYFDEVAIPYTVMSRGLLFDVERVEVLKGPQGDLYGRNTTAGQINYISRKPTQQFEAGITASYGRFDVLNLEGFVNGPLMDTVSGRLAFRLVDSNEGWQESLTRPGDELGEKNVGAVRGMLDIDVSPRASLLINVHYVDDQSDNQAQTALDGREIGLNEFNAPHVALNEYRLPGGRFFGQTPPWYSIGDNRAADWNNHWVSPITGEVADLRPARDNELLGVSAKLELDIGETTLTSITAYHSFERSETNDVDGRPNSIQENINDTDLSVFSQEIRLAGETDRLLWLVGLYYSKDEVDEFYNFFMQDSVFGDGSAAFGAPTPFAVFPIYRLHTRYVQDTESAAAFGHVEYRLTEKLRLTVGVRYTDEQRDWAGCTYDAGDGGYVGLWNGIWGASLQPGACSTLTDTAGSPNNIANLLGTPNINDAFQVFVTDISTKRWMGKVGLDYAINENVLVYATLSNGFKSGGFNGNNSNTTTQLEPYEPEKLTSLEFGIKATLLDERMQLNAAVFQYDYQDKQESERAITPVGAIGGLGNVPESEIRGVEVDLNWAPTDGLTLALGVAWLDTEIEEWMAPVSGTFDFGTGEVTTINRVDASGSALPQAPEWSLNALVRYEFQVSQDLVVDLTGDINFTDDMPDPVRAQNSIESYTVANVRVGIGDISGAWRAMIWVRNLADEYYYVSAFGGPNGGLQRTVGMPRTYGVSLERNF